MNSSKILTTFFLAALASTTACGADDPTFSNPTTTAPGSGGAGGMSTSSGGAGGGSDPCLGVTCDTPPDDVCADGTSLTHFDSAGTCSDGACSYASSSTTCAFVCKDGACTGVCMPDATQCNGLTPQSCDASGAWQSGAACTWGEVCSGGMCITATTPPSCIGDATGQADCGPGANESCCISLAVPGGTVQLDATHTATVSDFKLDKYEVTVGRFRKFVDAWVGGWRPAAGAGKHVHLNGGQGLSNGSGGYESGWDTAWSTSLGTTKAAWDTNLACDAIRKTWTNSAGGNEKRPINCATWFEQVAFCIWDGGFLPSEAEWQYAAAGGSEGRQYPWSNPPSSTTIDCTYANYYNGGYCVNPPNGSTSNVGSTSPKGEGRWGHSDLAGNVWEWVQDWYKSPYPLSANTNYTNSTTATDRVVRGGGFDGGASHLLASARYDSGPAFRSSGVGARCLRSAP